jgi:hypothetical protein
VTMPDFWKPGERLVLDEVLSNDRCRVLWCEHGPMCQRVVGHTEPHYHRLSDGDLDWGDVGHGWKEFGAGWIPTCPSPAGVDRYCPSCGGRLPPRPDELRDDAPGGEE